MENGVLVKPRMEYDLRVSVQSPKNVEEVSFDVLILSLLYLPFVL